jgi:toxin-antitoxin system PIN domain toxin
MLIADVNVFVGAHRAEINRHDDYRVWLERRLIGPEVFGVSELVLSAFLRLTTNHRIFSEPTPVDVALDFCRVVRSAPATVIVRPSDRHWPIFADLCSRIPARGNLIPDAYLAAMAIEAGATFVTRDRGFARFSGVRLLDPLADSEV